MRVAVLFFNVLTPSPCGHSTSYHRCWLPSTITAHPHPSLIRHHFHFSLSLPSSPCHTSFSFATPLCLSSRLFLFPSFLSYSLHVILLPCFLHFVHLTIALFLLSHTLHISYLLLHFNNSISSSESPVIHVPSPSKLLVTD